MSASKDLLHTAVQTWLIVEGLPDTVETYQAGVDAITCTIPCSQCMALFSGTRHEARQTMWEPRSRKTQHAADYGPMACPSCIDQLLTDLLAGMKKSHWLS